MKLAPMGSRRPFHTSTAVSASGEAAMDLLTQLENLKLAAERAGESDLAARVAALFEDYVNRYCDARRAGLEDRLRHYVRPPKDYLN